MVNIITTVYDYFFVHLFWQCVVEENTDHNYSLCPLHLVSLCCSVSDNCTAFFFFLKWVFGSFFVVVLFQYALRETVNNCIIHWTEEDGTHYVYLKLVSWCNKRWRWVVFLNVLLEASLDVRMVFFPAFWILLKVSTGVGGCKTKSFHWQTHTPTVPAPHIQRFDVVHCLVSTTNQSPS